MVGISIIVGITGLFLVSQIYINYSTKGIETYKYDMIKSYKGFEIRLYQKALFSYVIIPKSSYKESSSKGFRILAGYIFGGNSKEEKIAMTSPVEMTMDDSITVKFMVPKSHNIDNLPQPSDSQIAFKTEPQKYLAALTFGGFANDEVIRNKIEELTNLLEHAHINHSEEFSYMGYNPPYQFTNRRNEVVVEIDISSIE